MPTKKNETRMSDADFATAKAMFSDNDEGLKFLRKIFYPEVDVTNPIGINFDLWTKLDLNGLTPEQKIIKVEANQMLIAHIEACLSIIKTIAGTKEESANQTRERLTKDSSK